MNPDDRPRTLSPDRVDWVPSSPDAIEVRVFGSWHGPTVPPPAVLVVGDERIAELGAPPGDDVPPAWSAAFLVPVELRSAVEGGDASLEVSGLVVGLPPARPGRMVAPAAAIGTVIDPAVLAERRARRAEIAEQSATQRATSAEQAASTLRAQLVHLEERLTRAAEDRDALAARVADAERRLRLAEQREEAERRRRGELEEELAAERRSVEHEVHELSDQLASAEEITEALERELVTARRREEAERVAREAVDRQLREALDRVAALEGASGDEREELRRQAAALSDRLAEAEAERARLQGLAVDLEQVRVRLVEAEAERGGADELARRLAAAEAERDELRARADAAPAVDAGQLEALQAEIAELRRRLEETEAALEDERAAHAATERARRLAAERTQEERAAREAAERRGGGDPSARERELAGQVAALEEEIAGRAATHRRVQEAIDAVRSELGRVREQVRQTTSARAPEIQALTERVQVLEDLVRQRDAELEVTRQALSEAERAADEARVRGTADADTLREGFESRVRELSEAVAEMRRRLRETTSDFEARLDAERRRREAAETALEQLRAATRAEAAAAAEAGVEAARSDEAEVEPSAAPDASHETPPFAEMESVPASDASPEPEASTGDDALDALIAGLREQVDSAREQLRAWDEPPTPTPTPTPAPPVADPGDATTERLRAIEADIRAAVPDPEASVPARDIIASLQHAADRLRAAAEEELAIIEADEATGDQPVARADPDEPADDEPLARAEAGDPAEAPLARLEADEPTDEPLARVEDVGAQGDDVEREDAVEVMTSAPPATADVAGETPRPATSSAPAPSSAVAAMSAAPGRAAATPAGPLALGPRPVDFGAGESPWLRTAIERLSRSEPARAAELLVALLPAQAMAGVDLTYVLTAPTLGAVRVVLSDGTVQVERGPSSLTADARISGSLATLAPLAAGGGGWRATRGVRIDGARRPARKLLRRRRPVGLGDFAALTPPPDPGLVLAALAAAVDPAWTLGHRFGVVYEIGAERWTVLAEDGAPLELSDAEGPHAATVSLPAEAFLPALQGAASTATVAGDRRAADVLHAWFDRARGVTAG